jgi:ferric-dicitrate binding protein FerR (iron transport regulator)
MTSENSDPRPARPVALVTGAGRTAGLGAGIAWRADQRAAADEQRRLQLTEGHP